MCAKVLNQRHKKSPVHRPASCSESEKRRTAGDFGSVLAGFFRVVYVRVIRRSLGVLVPAAGLSDHGGGHERDARGEAGDALAKFSLVLPLPCVCVVDVNVLHPVAFVVGAPAQDVDAAVQHGHAGFSVSGWEGG